MLTRRNVLGAAMTSAWGGRQVRRIDQRPRQKSAAGSGPAPSSAIIIARVIIVKGTAGGVFIYDASGNLIASMAAQANVDPLTHSNLAGITDYDPSTSRFSELLGSVLTFSSRAGGSFIVSPATVHLVDALAAGTNPDLTIDSPGASFAGAGSRIVLAGPNSNLTAPNAQITLTDQSHSGGITTALVEARGSMAVGASLSNIREWYSPSGGDDFAALNTALSSYGSADLLPAPYLLSAKLTATGATLQGCDMATTIGPFGGYAGALLGVGSKGTIRNLSVQNSGSDAIQVAGGVANWWLTDLFFQTNAGNCINATITGPSHGRIRGIRGGSVGSSNGGGIRIDGGTGAFKIAEVNISDVDIQQCNVSEVLFLSAVTDVLVDQVNGAIATGTAANAITIQGQCTTCYLDNVDVGGGSGTGVAVFQAAGGNSPSDCRITGKLQQGNVGLVVNDGTARSWFEVVCSSNQGDGAQFNGNGILNKLFYSGNLNNAAAGVAYDIDITGSVHVYVDAPQASGGAVTANCNITLVANHATVNNVPAGFTFAGNAQAGW